MSWALTQEAESLRVEWPASVRVGVPFDVRASWPESKAASLESVPAGALPGKLWAPFEATALGPVARSGERMERNFELVLLAPPLDGTQLAASLTLPGAEVWLRPVGGGAVEVRRAPRAELPLTAQVPDTELVRFERLPWDFAPPAPSAWPLWLAGIAALALGARAWPRWRAHRRARRERRAPLRAIEAWLSSSAPVDGAALHAVSGHLRALAQSATGDGSGRFTVEEARAADAPRSWSARGRQVLWRWWSAEQRWSYGRQLPEPDEARTLTADLERALPELREQVEVRA